LKVSTHVKIAMQCFENFGGQMPQMPQMPHLVAVLPCPICHRPGVPNLWYAHH